MKLVGISLILNVLAGCKASNLLRDEPSYEKKPQQPKDFISFHDYQSTPFLSNETFTEFLNTPIDSSTGMTFGEISSFNSKIRDSVQDLVNQNFFRIYRLNLFKECPFWKGDGFCMHSSCAVDTIDDWKDLPEIWQPEYLGHIENSSLVNEMNENNEDVDDDKQYCELDDVNDETVFVDLIANPERFTGYGGDQSWQIWQSIYNENCFNLGHDQCVEKNFFYKLVSGMHASISTHLSNDFFDKSDKTYKPNLHEFMFRVGDHLDRLQNIYLNYIIVLKSLVKLDTFGVLDKLDYHDVGSPCEKDATLKCELKTIVDEAISLSAHKSECMFQEDVLFQDDDSDIIKTEIKENFRNITRIMDCVHCDRCRLWGKVQTTGYGTALKVLFELHDKDDFHVDVSNIELIALVNTFDRLSKTIMSVQNFKKLYDDAIIKEENGESTGDSMNGTLDMFDNPLMAKKRSETKFDYDTSKIFQKNEPKEEFNEIVYPEIEGLLEGESFQEAFVNELQTVLVTLKWVLNSYFIFPKVIYNWVLIRLVYYWNIFVGHVSEDFDFDRLYRMEI